MTLWLHCYCLWPGICTHYPAQKIAKLHGLAQPESWVLTSLLLCGKFWQWGCSSSFCSRVCVWQVLPPHSFPFFDLFGMEVFSLHTTLWRRECFHGYLRFTFLCLSILLYYFRSYYIILFILNITIRIILRNTHTGYVSI